MRHDYAVEATVDHLGRCEGVKERAGGGGEEGAHVRVGDGGDVVARIGVVAGLEGAADGEAVAFHGLGHDGALVAGLVGPELLQGAAPFVLDEQLGLGVGAVVTLFGEGAVETLGAGECGGLDSAAGGYVGGETKPALLAAAGAADHGDVEIEGNVVVGADAHDEAVGGGGGEAGEGAGEGRQAREEGSAALAVVDQETEQAGRAAEVDRVWVSAVGLGHRVRSRAAAAAAMALRRARSSGSSVGNDGWKASGGGV